MGWIDHPIFRRETLILRRGKIPAILFVGGPFLISLMHLFYYLFNTFMRKITLQPIHGRELFARQSILLFWAMVLLATGLMGESLDKDRRSGALSALRLTSVTTWSIVVGKASALVVYLCLFYLACTPVLGLNLLAGGIAPEEIGITLLITLVTAIQCSLLAIIALALVRHNLAAITVAFLLCLGYLLALPGLLSLLQWGVHFGQAYLDVAFMEKAAENLQWFHQEMGHCIFPVYAISRLFEAGAVPVVAWGGLRIPFWLLTLGSIGSTSLATAALASLLLRWELWQRIPRSLSQSVFRRKGCLFAQENLLDEKRNPFLDWELRRHPVSRYMSANRVLAASILLLILGWVFFNKIGDANSSPFGVVGIVIYGFASFWVVLIPILYCSQTVVREKEMGTYDSLLLTLLQPRQIIEAKIISCLLYVAPVLGIAALFAVLRFFISETYPFQFYNINLISLGYLLLCCVYYGMLGMVFSLYCSKSLQALAYTLIAECLITIPFSILMGIISCFFAWGMMWSAFAMSSVVTNMNPLLGEYLIALFKYGAKGLVLLVIIRILYDRAINLIRFEAYRR